MNRRNGVLQGIKASLSVVNTSSQGLSKALARLHYPYSNLLLKGPARFVWLNLISPCFVCVTPPQGKASARLQQGFSLFVQTVFSRALQGFSKGPFLLFKNSCQGLCKGRLQRALLFITQSIGHGTGNQQICTPHLLI